MSDELMALLRQLLPHDDALVYHWLHKPREELGDLTPVNYLKGNPEGSAKLIEILKERNKL